MQPLDEHNVRLLEHVHPSRWQNPKPQDRYHLVVIGAGTAGLVTAAGAAGLGARVALIERQHMGGDCLNVGCVPSKALIAASRAVADAHRCADLGIGTSPGSSGANPLDFTKVMERMRRLRADIAPNDSASRFDGLGVDVFFGDGCFSGPKSIEVAGATLNFGKAVIASGARATIPKIPGLTESNCLTNENLFNLTTMPDSMVILGGGPIGCEMAQTFARFGCRVTIVERSQQVLGREDTDAASIVKSAMERDGVRILLNSSVLKVDGKRLTIQSHDVAMEFDVDAILVAAGRTPNVEGLELEAAGIQFNSQGVIVNDRLQTSNPNVFAAGDVCSRFKFTHAADFMARTVIQNALFLGRARVSSLIIPWCTYTSPELAHVGLTERDAMELGIQVRSFTQEFRHIDRSILDGSTDGFVKILTNAHNDQIVGATIVADVAGEMIGEVVLAMKHKIGLGKLASTIHPYPTVAEAIRKCGDSYNRTRLTPLIKRLFKWWLAWR